MSKKLPVAIQVYGLRDLLENTPENFKDVMQKGGVWYLPLYMAMFL